MIKEIGTLRDRAEVSTNLQCSSSISSETPSHYLPAEITTKKYPSQDSRRQGRTRASQIFGLSLRRPGVRSQKKNLSGTCGGHSGTGTGFASSTLTLPCQHHSTMFHTRSSFVHHRLCITLYLITASVVKRITYPLLEARVLHTAELDGTERVNTV
jgi:hypothetical protein